VRALTPEQVRGATILLVLIAILLLWRLWPLL